MIGKGHKKKFVNMLEDPGHTKNSCRAWAEEQVQRLTGPQQSIDSVSLVVPVCLNASMSGTTTREPVAGNYKAEQIRHPAKHRLRL